MGFTRADLKAMSLAETVTWLRAAGERRKKAVKAAERRIKRSKGAMGVVDLGRID